MSPIAVLWKGDEVRVILDLSYGVGGHNGERARVNGDTDFAQAPQMSLVDTLPSILELTSRLLENLGSQVPTYISKMDVAAASRHIPVEWARAPVFDAL